MDQKELDDAYDQFVYAPNARQVIARCHRNSELVRERLGAPKRLAYGPGPIERLDIYSTKTADAPINVYIHGGAWQAEVAESSASQAEMLVNAGAVLVVLDFASVIETLGNLMTMADQVRRGVVWVYKNAEELRWRSRVNLCQRPFLRWSLGWRAAHDRLAKGLRCATDDDQGRRCWQRHV